MNIIRKLSVGSDYKNAMHYVVGQEIYGGAKIHQIIRNDEAKEYSIFVKREGTILYWKGWNFNMPIGIENNIDF